jgi:hypothetical protein
MASIDINVISVGVVTATHIAATRTLALAHAQYDGYFVGDSFSAVND